MPLPKGVGMSKLRPGRSGGEADSNLLYCTDIGSSFLFVGQHVLRLQGVEGQSTAFGSVT